MANVLVYVSWPVIRRWKRAQRARASWSGPGPELPFAYGTGQARLFGLARRGGVLWVVSAPRFGLYRLPPTLIAQLRVEKVVDRRARLSETDRLRIPPFFPEPWRYVALAIQSGSRYFPLNNVYRVLTALRFEGGRALEPEACGHCQRLIGTGKGLYAGIPSHLQTLREVAPGSVPDLEAYAAAVGGRRVAFLSYRRSEAEPLAARLVEVLTEQDVNCWYDHWMMPRPVANGNVRIHDPVLEGALSDGLRQSAWIIALATPGYGAGWTGREWRKSAEQAEDPSRTAPLARLAVLLGGTAPGADREVDGRGVSADELAERVVNLLLAASSHRPSAFPEPKPLHPQGR